MSEGGYSRRGRALSAEAKRAIVDRIYEAWLKNPELRLGQLIVNAGDSQDSQGLFYIEDEPFALRIEAHAEIYASARISPSVAKAYIEWLHTRVQVRPDVLGGEPTFGDSRLAIAAVAGRLRAGDSRDSILRDYPYLTEQDLVFSLRYCG